MSDDKQKKPVQTYNRTTGEMQTLAGPRNRERFNKANVAAPKDTPRLTEDGGYLSRDLDGKEKDAEDVTQKERKAVKPKVEIHNLAELLRAYYEGRIKIINEDALRHTRGGQELGEDASDRLTSMALERDPTLDKTLGLLLMSQGHQGYSNVEERIRHFSRGVIVRCAIPTVPDVIQWMPSSGADIQMRLTDVASAANLLVRNVQQIAQDKDIAKRSVSIIENTFCAAVAWRYLKGQSTFDEIARAIQKVMEPDKQRDSGIMDLVRLLSKTGFNGSDGLAHLLLHLLSVIDQRGRENFDLERKATDVLRRFSEVDQALQAAQLQVKALEREVDDLHATVRAERETQKALQAHATADVTSAVNQTYRLLDRELPVLRDGLTALERDPPKLAVAREYLSAALENLQREFNRLKDQKE